MKSESEIRTAICEFFVENFLMGEGTLAVRDDESLLEAGIIDSTGMLEMVMFLEQHFGLKVEDRELVPENLDSLSNLVQFVGRKLRAAR
jgi:acyl carrier protein